MRKILPLFVISFCFALQAFAQGPQVSEDKKTNPTCLNGINKILQYVDARYKTNLGKFTNERELSTADKKKWTNVDSGKKEEIKTLSISRIDAKKEGKTLSKECFTDESYLDVIVKKKGDTYFITVSGCAVLQKEVETIGGALEQNNDANREMRRIVDYDPPRPSGSINRQWQAPVPSSVTYSISEPECYAVTINKAYKRKERFENAHGENKDKTSISTSTCTIKDDITSTSICDSDSSMDSSGKYACAVEEKSPKINNYCLENNLRLAGREACKLRRSEEVFLSSEKIRTCSESAMATNTKLKTENVVSTGTPPRTYAPPAQTPIDQGRNL